MNNRVSAFFSAAALICLIATPGLALDPYSQDFETMLQTSTTVLGDDGWVVYGNVFNTEGTYVYGYGTYPAPNDGSGFCEIVVGEGGDQQGAQQLVVYSDYNSGSSGKR